MSSHVTVSPETFSLVEYDADRIAEITREVAARLQLSNPISVAVDETTPLAKMSAEIDTASSDTTIVVKVQSGALEDTKNLTTFDDEHARRSLTKVMLRAVDRLRDEFADAPPDLELTNEQNAAWDAYCGGRMERLGLAPTKQAYLYDFRNRFGFGDDVDALFERIWAADELGWHDLPS
jgi:hypothetical protein